MRSLPTVVPARASLACLFLVLFAAVPAAAAPLAGDVVPIRQPDGTLVDVVVWGDEFYAVAETRDGFALTPDAATGFLCYARLSDDGRTLVSTGVPAGTTPPAGLAKHLRVPNDAAREQALAARADFERRAHDGPLAPPPRRGRGPSIGQVDGIVLVIDFSDDVGTIPPSTVSDYCNTPGFTGYGNNGSVYDYFSDVSEGLLKYSNYVPTAYYRASHTKAYYCDSSIPYGQRARQLIVEALTAMNAAGFDFSEYDADDDGVIDALNCFYAGERWNSWAQGLWPHSWTVDYCADGVCTYRYQITNMGTQLTLGTFCHENGHMLMGWPDLYDYDYDSKGAGVFCLMAYGGFALNPAEPCAYMKMDAGWADVTLLEEAADDLPVPDDGNVMYKYEHPTEPNEYYLIENRQRVSRDAGLPDAGLAIWHVDEFGDNSNQQQTPELHYLVTLVQADGNWDLEHNVNSGDAGDLYAAPGDVACTPATDPDTAWWSGEGSSLSIMGVSASGETMTFDYSSEPPSAPTGFEADGAELCALLRWSPVDAALLDHYLVERDTSAAFGPATVSEATSDTAFVAYPLTAGTEYFFRVSSVDAYGGAGPPTAALSAVPTADVQPPAATGLAALAGDGVVELVWDSPLLPDVEAFHVVRDSTLAFATPETLAHQLDGPFVDASCPAGQARWYRLVGEDHGGLLGDPCAPVAGVAVAGRGWYVDASYVGFEMGTFLQPYRTVTAAIAAASSGDAVVVLPGDYDEAVALKNGVPLVGMHGAGVTTVAAGMTAFGVERTTVLKGLRVDGAGSATVGLDCTLSDLVVEDCRFMAATGAGVNCHDGGTPLIRGCLFTGNTWGICCAASGPVVVSNTFESNSSADIANFGSPGPTVGGSLAAANDFLEPGTTAIANYDSVAVAAEYNHWGDDCADPSWFTGPVDYTPWTDASHTLVFTECWTGVPEAAAPAAAYLRPGVPNPTSGGTTIAFGLPDPCDAVTLRIYSATGRLVRTLLDGALPGGHHVVRWDGRDDRGRSAASGVYVYRLEAGGIGLAGKVAVLR